MTSQPIDSARLGWRGILGEDRRELAGRLEVEKVVVNRAATRMTACFLADTLVEESDFQAVRRALTSAFPGVWVQLRIASPALAADVTADIGKYAPFLSACLVRHYPMIKYWLDSAAWRMDDPRVLELEIPAPEAVRFLKESDVLRRLERVMAEVFRLKVEARVSLRDDHERVLAELREEKRRDDAALAASYARRPPEPPAGTDGGAANGAPGRKVLGRGIADPPIPVAELAEDSGRAVIRGEVLSSEAKELKGGAMRLLSFALTDYTSTVQCKAFLRYRSDYRKNAAAEDREPSEADRRRVQDVVDAVRPGEWLTVRGECRYDGFSREVALMVSDICREPKPRERTDGAERKRVELHLHTHMSSMDGLASASALIEQAAAWGHPAIAVTDHGVVQAFPEAFDAAARSGIKLIPGMEGYLADEGAPGEKPGGGSHHIILLAATPKGLENINRLVSEGHLNHYRRRPRLPRRLLEKYREGIIVGSACESGELFQAVLERRGEDELDRVARFYDYLEIQPVGNNGFLAREGRVDGEEGLRELNRRIVALGERLGIPVVATGDVHFLNPKDAVYRAILMAGQGFEDADSQPPLYLKTTGEMLEEFAYLGPEKCEEVVIGNPRKIADRVGRLTLFPPHPEGKETFQPLWESAAESVRGTAVAEAALRYGDPLPGIVQARLDKELGAIIGYGFATLYHVGERLVKKSLADGYLVGSRGSVGSSLVATLCGITEVNPLPPHYRCGRCRYSAFEADKARHKVGADLPPRDCPECGEPLVRDGFDIPFEVFLGFEGDKVPDIDLNFSGVYQARAHAYAEELFGKDHCFRAGTIATLADKTAYGFVSKYCEERGMAVTEAEKNRLVRGCVGVKRTTGQHPGGMVLLPEEYEIYQFTAIQRPADDPDSDTVTTHYDFGSMHNVLVKLDILGHDDPTVIRMLGDLSGVPPSSVPLADPGVMSLFSSPEALKVSAAELGANTGTLGIPEFGTRFVRQMLEETKPTTMEELIRISGLSHGEDVWVGNAQDLIRDGTAPLSECICTRDDIMNALIGYGVSAKAAFDIMENVRKKGKGPTPAMVRAMEEQRVPDWFIASCKKIQYLFPKGHAVAYVTMALRIAWYKLYKPEAYYAAYFTVRGGGFDARTMLGGADSLRGQLGELDEAASAPGQKLSAKELDSLVLLEVALEMNLRGIRFAPVDLYRSDANEFRILEPGLILPPLTALPGLGESAARSVALAREGGRFLSVEELKGRTKATAAHIEALRAHGCLGGMPESSQVSLFSLMDE